MKDSTVTFTLYAATAIAAIIAGVYLVKKGSAAVGAVASGAKAAAGAVVTAVNPADSGNLINRAANTLFGIANDIDNSRPLGSNVDSIGTYLYGLFNPGDTAGAIATAPSIPRAPVVVKASDYFDSVAADDFALHTIPQSIVLGDYSDAVNAEDAALGAMMNGFTSADTAPAYINYSAAFKTNKAFQ
jgi:hypothetical protein